jgi:hypothetical protein
MTESESNDILNFIQYKTQKETGLSVSFSEMKDSYTSESLDL